MVTSWAPCCRTYQPKRQRRPPDRSLIIEWVLNWLGKMGKSIEHYIDNLPNKSKHSHSQRNHTSSRGRHLFSLRLRRKGYVILRSKGVGVRPRAMRKRGDDASDKAFALASTAATSTRPLIFDADSITLALDNCSSFCLTNNLNDFIGKPRKVRKGLSGLGSAQVQYEGTVRWAFEDDEGRVHSWDMPNTNYSPDIPIRLFSLQHWAQCNRQLGAHSDTNGDRVTLEWDGHVRTVPLNSANVAFLRTASGYRGSGKIISALSALLPTELICFPVHLIPPDNDD
jgi:hypothetical protein